MAQMMEEMGKDIEVLISRGAGAISMPSRRTWPGTARTPRTSTSRSRRTSQGRQWGQTSNAVPGTEHGARNWSKCEVGHHGRKQMPRKESLDLQKEVEERLPHEWVHKVRWMMLFLILHALSVEILDGGPRDAKVVADRTSALPSCRSRSRALR